MNLAQYLLAGVEDGERAALLTLQADFTREEIRQAAGNIAGALVESGLTKGDRVLLLADNSFFWVAAYLGIIWAGGIAVPLAVSLDQPDVEFIAASTQARFACAQARFAPSLLRALPGATVILDGSGPPESSGHSVLRFEDVVRGADSPPFCEVDEVRDPAAIMFTSGSTGKPRGVIVSHRNIAANTDSIIQYLGLESSDRMMVVLPFFYCYGTSLLHTHLRAGASLVLDARFMFPDKVLQRMIDAGCTGFAGVPSHYQILLRNSSLPKMRFPRLRHLQQAGGNLPPVFLETLQRALPDTQVFVMYGQTEATARLSYLPPDMLDRKIGSIGQGIPGVQLSVEDEDGRLVRPGEIGEIVASGENIALGYWREDEETAATFRNGRLHTGDLATVDQDGFLFIVDRAKDFLKCGGNRVSCKRVEEMLVRFPELVEAAVIAIPDDVNGEAVKAFVVPRAGAAAGVREHLEAFCAENFPSHLVPREIVVVKDLPRNSAGKVARAALKAMAQPA